MQIIKITPRAFGANTYVLTSDGKTAVVIDPAQPRVESQEDIHLQKHPDIYDCPGHLVHPQIHT